MDVFTYLASTFHVSTIPNSSGRLFSPKPTACLQSLCSVFVVEPKLNPVVGRIDLPAPTLTDMRVRIRRSLMLAPSMLTATALGQRRRDGPLLPTALAAAPSPAAVPQLSTLDS